MSEAQVETSYPLSPMQQGMLIHQLGGGAPGTDLEQAVGELRERIGEDALARAVRELGRRHPALRTRFRWVGLEEPLQEVLVEAAPELATRDLPPAATRADLDAFLAEDRHRGFDLGRAPLIRFTLLRAGPARSWLVVSYAHAVLDGECIVPVLQDLFALVRAARDGGTAALPQHAPYAGYIDWLGRHLEATRPASREFFRDLLGGIEAPTRLTSLQRASGEAPALDPGGRFTEKHFVLSEECSAALDAFCDARGVRVWTAFEAVFGFVLGCFTGDGEVLFGSTRGCRRSAPPEFQDSVGLCINTLPVRLRLDPAQSLTAWLQGARAQQVALRAHEQFPLAEITACSALPAGTPLFENIVVFVGEHNNDRLRAEGGDWLQRDFDWIHQTSFPLNLMGYGGRQVRGKLSYDRALYPEEAASRLAAHLVAAFEALAAAGPEATVGDLPRVLPEERARLARWNRTEAPLPVDLTVHGPIAAQAARTPDRTAIVFRDRSLSYAELEARAEALAAELRQLGVLAGDRVGIFAERSTEMVVGLLGILKAGAAYVPLDPAYPRERIVWMLEDSASRVLLTTEALRPQLPATAAQVVAIDAARPAAGRSVSTAGGEDIAYVLFTSGSTGRPKGVQVRHRNVANFFAGMDALLGDDPPGTWLAVTSISFDISVLELFWTLARGYTVVVQEDATRSFASAGNAGRSRKPLEFSLFYFAADAGGAASDRYRLLLEGARFADTHGFSAVWTPERHFHAFGGLYPNPSLTSAALAVITRNVQLRAGSVVLPLHNPIRCAEEWSVVDNLSGGRVGLSFASGWHAADFALAPDNFADRRRLMAEGIETIRRLWRGEEIQARGGDGREVSVRIFPPPVQREPRIWLTAGGNPETFALAGRLGASILTNLLVMKRDELVSNIAVYRKAYREAGHTGDGHVSLMLHTFIGDDEAEVLRTVRKPFLDYLRTSTDLIAKTRWETTSFARPAGASDAAGPAGRLEDLDEAELEALLDHAFARYVNTAGLFGTPESCRAKALELQDLGVDEVACLLDFGVETERTLASLPSLDRLRQLCAAQAAPEGFDASLAAQLQRHRVTHLQCTPSLAAMMLADPRTRAALHPLHRLLLGGEALPPPLADELGQVTQAQILNMYGPTETTVWSTVARVLPGLPITLGRPIANTTLLVIDARLQPLPPGVAGELLIGGAGVAAGYLGRPEVTAARFVKPPGEIGTWYRTGDLVRFLDDGDLQFLGRVDHQVKIGGHRIELGEIEATLGKHPDVSEAVVVAQRLGTGDQRLIAYVAARDRKGGNGAAVEGWKAVWEETYREEASRGELAGWRSSYTGAALPEAEMREWREATVDRINELAPRRALEIGFGTGMLLLDLAPRCERYVGVDFSAEAVARLRQVAASRGLSQVQVEQRAAHDLANLPEAGFDTIVLNSVAQYFPDVDYLLAVLDAAWARLLPGGALFAGDLRSLPLLEAFWTSVEQIRSPGTLPPEQLLAKVRQAMARDRELVVDPELFEALAHRWPDLADVRARLKSSAAANEMSRFRYDVVLRKATTADSPLDAIESRPGREGLPSIREALRGASDVLRVTDIPNARVVDAVRAAAALRGASETADATPVDPGQVAALAPGYKAEAQGARSGDPARFDALFVRDGVSRPRELQRPAARPWASYANQPARGTVAQDLPGVLSAHLRERLPVFMLPARIVVIDKLPRTPNGKIDRAALPRDEPAAASPKTGQRPLNELEQSIASVFEALLSVGKVSAEANFFELGANSLLLVRASSKLEEKLQRPVSLVDFFRFPTIRQLAERLGQSEGPARAAGVESGESRAQARRDLLQRRGNARPKR